MIPSLMGRKKVAGLILGMHEKPMEKMADGGMAGEAGPLSVVAKELIDAVKADDVDGVVAAMKACYSALEAGEDAASEEG